MKSQSNCKNFMLAGSFFALTAVILGAFGAHGLKNAVGVSPDLLAAYKTGVQYQFYHAFAILLTAVLAYITASPTNLSNQIWYKRAAWLFCAGIVLFSGSIYLLATRSLTHLPGAVLGPLTPIGGLCFIAGWALLIIAISKTNFTK